MGFDIFSVVGWTRVALGRLLTFSLLGLILPSGGVDWFAPHTSLFGAVGPAEVGWGAVTTGASASA